jgi:nucleotide-binding universal stress UspA family protein
MLRIERILVPVDFSDHAEAALAHAVELARTHHAHLLLLHVLEEPSFPSFHGAGAAALYEEQPDLKVRATDALQDWVAAIDAPQPPTTAHVIEGATGPSIVAFAEERGADLIVLAALGRTGLQRVLLGSVAGQVVREASCSVFVLKSATSSLVPGRPPVETSDHGEP